MRGRRVVGLATLCAAVLPVTVAHADPARPATLELTGQGGDAYVVTASTSWQLDYGRAAIRGGNHYAGMALELLGHPANDGLSTLLVTLPDRINGPASRTTALGAGTTTMPPGRYLLVVLGDRSVHVSVPLMGNSHVTTPTRIGKRHVAFRQAQGAPTFAPQPTGLYDARLTLPLPAFSDPLVASSFVIRDATGAHTQGSVSCVHKGNGRCSDADVPDFGTGEQEISGGGSSEDREFWDGADGLSAAAGWSMEADYRASADGAQLYAAYVVVSGANH
jgi:hypothetical protein